MIKLYDFLESGNGYKVRLMLHFLKQPYELVEVNILEGKTHTDEFLAINPVGKIPAILLEDGRRLFESNAILNYLAHGSNFIPSDPFQQAQMLSWMFFEQYSHEPNIAVMRFWKHYVEMTPGIKAQMPAKEKKGYEALDIMETGIKYSPSGWLVGDYISLADICLFAYTHVAEEGGFDLSRYPAILDWIERIKAQDNYVPITYRQTTS